MLFMSLRSLNKGISLSLVNGLNDFSIIKIVEDEFSVD